MMWGERFERIEKIADQIVNKIVRDLSREVPRIVETTISPIKTAVEIVAGYRRPYSEVYLTDDEVTLVVEMPGASKETIEINVNEDSVNIHAKFSEELLNQAPRYSVFKSKGYKVSVTLPVKIEEKDAKAIYKDGVLVIKAPVKKPKGVSIKVE